MAAERVAARFAILGPVGSGNMGEVYRAFDERTGAEVALKVIRRNRSGDPIGVGTDASGAVGSSGAVRQLARFEREIRIMERIEHPGVPRTVAGGLDGDLPYLAMEFVDGVTLRRVLDERGRLPVAWAAAIGVQVADAMDAVHLAGVVHRDLKPSNVMLTRSGAVKVLDFGVGFIVDAPDVTRLTSTDATVGTVQYMAPEQTAGGAVDAAADMYALGCLLFEMLAGAPPFRGASAFAVMRKHVDQLPTPVRTLRGSVPAAFDTLIARLLAKQPDERPTPQEARAALLPIALGGADEVGGPSVDADVEAYNPTRPLRLNSADDAVTAGASAAVAVGGARREEAGMVGAAQSDRPGWAAEAGGRLGGPLAWMSSLCIGS